MKTKKEIVEYYIKKLEAILDDDIRFRKEELGDEQDEYLLGKEAGYMQCIGDLEGLLEGEDVN